MNKIPDITQALTDLYASKIRPYPVQSLWASKLGHPCRRYLVLEQTHWNTKAPITPALKMRFAIGNVLGDQIVRDLQDAFAGVDDVRIERQEVPIPPNDLGISGRLDAVLVLRGEGRDTTYVPIEIKTMSEHVFGKVRSLRDMIESDSLYLRQYPAQLMVYMYYCDCEYGVFVLKNKVSGEYRHIVVELDYEYVDALLVKAKDVQDAVAAYRAAKTKSAKMKTLPDRIDWTRDVCGRCDHLATCLPDMAERAGVVDLLGDLELAMMLSARDSTSGAAKAYKKADDAIQAHLAALCADLAPGDSRTILAPDHTITVKCGKRRTLNIPDEVKAKYETDSRTIRKKIERKDEKEGETDVG